MTKIKQIRLRKNMKAAEVAKKLNLTRAAITEIERQGIRQIAAAKRYAVILQCRPEELLEF